MRREIEEALRIKYVKLHFKVAFLEDCVLPMNKASALRGGMGEMLLRANCISDRDCDNCQFESECLVQRTMYSRYDHTPTQLSIGEKDSIGYVIECENYDTDFAECEELEFNMILFGKTIVYFSQILQAFYALGQNGIGKNKARFYITEVLNTRLDPIMYGQDIVMSNYKPETVLEYVNYRMPMDSDFEKKIDFKSPVSIKSNGKLIDKLDMGKLVDALKRRIYLLDCFEGIEDDDFWFLEVEIPKEISQNVYDIDVRRYSSRKDSKMTLHGIKGWIACEGISEDTLALLYAGELLHVGKNTSFGFGRYRIRHI